MINVKFNVSIDDSRILGTFNGKVPNLVALFNTHLEHVQSAGMFERFDLGDKLFIVFVSDWLEAGSQTCFAWTSEDKNDIKGFLEALAKFPQIFCKVIPALPL